VAHVSIVDAGYTLVNDLNFLYASNGNLWLTWQQEWHYDPEVGDPNDPHDVPASRHGQTADEARGRDKARARIALNLCVRSG
jgi:hypothetical protein